LKQTDKYSTLVFLIQKLDEFRAFKRSDPEKLRNYFMSEGYSSLFERIKKDLDSIAFFPEKMPGVPKLMKAAAVARQLFPLCFFSFVLAFLIKIGVFKVLNQNLYSLFLFTPMVIIFGFIITDQIVRRKIAQYEESHSDLHLEEKMNIKRAVEELSAALCKKIRTYNLDPTKYRMRLFFGDYSGLQVESEYREKVMFLFRKKYLRFMVKPAGKKSR